MAAAASDKLKIRAKRTGCEIIVAEAEKAKVSSGRNGIKFSLDLNLIAFEFYSIRV